MNLLEESLRIKKMMVIEQSSSDNYFKEFSEGNFNNLKEFLSNNSEFVNKLKRILHQDSIESIESSLVKSNKTNLIIFFNSCFPYPLKSTLKTRTV